MELSSLIIPLGIFSYSFMPLAVLTGARVIKLTFKHHRLLALIGIIGAPIHAALVIYLNYY
jgi:hypothetical protein